MWAGSRGALVSDGDHMVFEVFHDVHGGEDFAGGVGRAGVGAASADGAGVAVQELFPGEVLDAGGAEAGVFVHIFQVDGVHLEGAAGFQAAEEGVEGGGDHMDVLGEGDVEGEGEDDEQVQPPEDGLQDVRRRRGHSQRAEPAADDAANGDARFRAGSAGGDVKGMYQQGGNHQSGGEGDDDDGFALAGEVEAQAVGAGNPAAEQSPGQGGEDDDGEDVQIDAVGEDAGGGEDGFGQGVPDYAAEDEEQVGQAEGEEAPEDGGVSDAGQVEAAGAGVGASDALQDFALAEDDADGTGQSGQGAVEAGGGTSLEGESEDAAIDGVAGHGGDGQGQQIDANPGGEDAEAEEGIGRYHR